MSKSKVSLTFKPATLHEGKDWVVQYYIQDPVSEKLVRKKIRLNSIKSIPERRKYGKELVRELNERLYAGWNPFLEASAPNGFTKINVCIETFLKAKTKELRPDSMRSYRSFSDRFLNWLEKAGKKEIFVVNFESHHANAFLNELYRDESISNKTWNNYLTFFRSLWNWMVEQEYAVKNQFAGFTKKQAEKKERIVIPARERERIREYLEQKDPNLLIASLLVFHSLLRPKEISMLKPDYFMLKKQVIRIPAGVAKNRTERMATIPDALMPYLVEWNFNHAKAGDFIWSQNFVPGSTPVNSRKWAAKWDRMRNALKLPKQMVLYSLRDSGIIQLLQDGVSPRDVMLHADHSSLEITSQYVKQAFPEGMASIKGKASSF